MKNKNGTVIKPPPIPNRPAKKPATAAVAGFFAGLFGIGGGLITVPFLFFIFDYLNIDKNYLMHLAVGTSFSITILTSLSSILAHKKNEALTLILYSIMEFL